MKNIYKNIWVLIVFLAIYGCKEETLITYPETEGGNNIYFVEKYFNSSADTMMKAISLGLAPSTVKDTVIQIPIRTTGLPSESDRLVSVVPVDTSSMKLGVHYDFVSEPMIRAGRVTDSVKIILHRTEDLATTRVYIKFELKANEFFNTELKTKKNSINLQDLLSYQFYMDDMFPVPYLWTTFAGKSIILDQLGPYSRRKVELILEVLKVEPYLLYDSKYKLPSSLPVNWATYLKYWLNKEKSEGRTQYDENGKEILMGPKAR